MDDLHFDEGFWAGWRDLILHFGLVGPVIAIGGLLLAAALALAVLMAVLKGVRATVVTFVAGFRQGWSDAGVRRSGSVPPADA